MDWLSIGGRAVPPLVRRSFSCSRRVSTTISPAARPCTPTTSSTRCSRPARRRSTTATGSPSSPTARSSTRRCSTRSVRRRARSTWSATSFSRDRLPTSSSRRLSERARIGVNVTVVVDAIGSFNLWGRPLRRLREAGCRIESYQQLEWHRLARMNNRTHRELLVLDGKVAFIGGAGIADWWAHPHKKKRPWRDTMARIEGPDRRRAAGRRGRELAGVLRRDHHRAGLLSQPRGRRRHDGLRDQELAVGPGDRVARRVPAADGRRRPPRPHRDAVLPPGSRAAPRAGRRSRSAASRWTSSCRARTPTSAGCGWPAAACGASCSRPASASTNTGPA